MSAATNSRTDAQPHRTRHPLLRPVLELLDARRRPDAAAHPVARAGRQSAERNRARLKTVFVLVGLDGGKLSAGERFPVFFPPQMV